MIDTHDLLRTAFGAIDHARGLFRNHTLTALTRKGDRDFASNLDYAIEREVRAYLQERTPGIGFLGEEEGADNIDAGKPFWALDPVDGTSNLIHGVPLCAISLGLLHHKRPILGVVDLPMLDERYHASQGRGAFCNGQPIHVSDNTALRSAVIAIGDYAVGKNAERKNRDRFALTHMLAERAERVRMFGSAAIDLVWTAAGRLDGAVMLGNKAWDTSAGSIIVREAGGQVVDLDGTPHDLESTATVSAAPGILGDLLDLLTDAEIATTTGKPSSPA